MCKDFITFSFRDGSAQVDYSIVSRNNILLALVTLEALAAKETGLHIDDIRTILDEEKSKLKAREVVDIEENS